MWPYGNNFDMEDVDDGCMTQNYGVEVEFSQSSHASHYDQNLIKQILGYIRKIQEIIEVDFSSFQCVIFRCKWWDAFYRNNVKEYCDSVLLCIYSRNVWYEARDPYIFAKHYNQVFFNPIG